MYKVLLLFLPLLISLDTIAQCLTTPVPLHQKVAQSPFIFEGKVVHQQSVWNEKQDFIYTLNYIQVYKTLKQDLPDTILLVTKGGQINDILAVVHPNLSLTPNDYGLFFAQPADIPFTQRFKHPIVKPYAHQQGMITFDLITATAHTPFHQYQNIEQQLYRPISQQTKQIIKTKLASPYPISTPDKAAIAINTITPTTVVAGTGQVMTITGSGFGTFTPPAKVQFRNPNFFPPTITYQSVADDHILSWTNTQIQFIIPAKDVQTGKAGAGSGAIRVVSSAAELEVSDTDVQVLFNKANLNFREIDLVNTNGIGGYTFQYHNGFSTDAQTAFERAIDTWQCANQVPFTVSGTPNPESCPANDGINTVAFDDDCPLDAGTLAQTTQWFAACGNGDAFFMELDLIFARPSTVNWHFESTNPASNQKDFESICLHELGHAQGIEHVLTDGSTMFPALSDGEMIRAVDKDALNCSHLIAQHSSENNNCGGTTAILSTDRCGTLVKAKALLSGHMMSNGQMTTLLNSSSLLPLTQPYNNNPWNYDGIEGLSLLPMDITDWVLVQLMDANFTVIAQRAALLRNDGNIVDVDGQEGVEFFDLPANNYHLTIRHRNHLAITTQQPIAFPNATTLDLTNEQQVLGGNQQLNELTNGQYAMISGDVNADGVINVQDFNAYQANLSISNNYMTADLNGDGIVTVDDFNQYTNNSSRIGVSEIRY